MIRFVLTLGLSITLCASANAATVHRSKRPTANYARPNVSPPPAAGVAVPGWTDEQTRDWLSYPRVSG